MNTTNAEEKIIGYRYRDGEAEYALQDGNNYWEVSLMGGAEYEIHGKGFAPEVGSNTIIFDQDRNYHLYTGPFVA
jgi:hypothetical protein